MKCSGCGADFKEGAEFCVVCGKKLPKRKKCPKCGVEVLETVLFCTNCGYQFEKETEEVAYYEEAISSSKWKWVAIALIIALLIGGGTYWYFYEMPKNNSFIFPSPGMLSSKLTTEQAGCIKSLKIKGYMDATDFDFIKWNCLNVENLDLSDVVIEGYTGTCGTNEGYDATYNANEIPLGAFFHWNRSYNHDFSGTTPDEGMPSIKSIILPKGITAIRRNAFARAYNLRELIIPEGVTTIDYVSFAICRSLSSVSLPSTLNTLGKSAFQDCESLSYVRIKATSPPLLDSDVFKGIASNAILAVPASCRNEYLSSSWKKYFAKIIEE